MPIMCKLFGHKYRKSVWNFGTRWACIRYNCIHMQWEDPNGGK